MEMLFNHVCINVRVESRKPIIETRFDSFTNYKRFVPLFSNMPNHGLYTTIKKYTPYTNQLSKLHKLLN